MPSPFDLFKSSKQQEPLYQSSKMLNVKDFFSKEPKEDNDVEKIRDRNIDRLKLLQ